jgi:hypothetical protein
MLAVANFRLGPAHRPRLTQTRSIALLRAAAALEAALRITLWRRRACASGRIRPEDQAAMLAEVGKLKDVTWQTVTATGHTDSVGSVKYNSRLSARRAKAVKDYLVGKGLDRSMIKTQARAAAAPIADNESSDGRAKNRRAEIQFQGVRAKAQ